MRRATFRLNIRLVGTREGGIRRDSSNIKASIIQDSITKDSNRMTTFLLEYPRFIHSEFMTHRLFSRNSASSRAIPVERMVKHIKRNTAMPIFWGKNRRGMQSLEENNSLIRTKKNLPYYEDDSSKCFTREEWWREAMDSSIDFALGFHKAGYHKEHVNRILEPFTMMKVICSGTEFSNFFHLRRHKDAQREIRELADKMYLQYNKNVPTLLKDMNWHLPFVDNIEKENCRKHCNSNEIEELEEFYIKVSASCCAQISFRSSDSSVEKALRIYKQLVESKPIHASPFEHQARPITIYDIVKFKNGQKSGITHMDSQRNYWSGNLKGWIQYRQLIPGHTFW